MVQFSGSTIVEGSGAKFSLSWDGKSWTEARPDLGAFFPPAGPARYEYKLRCELDAATVPNGPSDTATFDFSTTTAISTSV